MRKKDVALEKKRLQEAQDAISDILIKEGFRIIKGIKYGPRFLIAEVAKGNKRGLFKICLFAKSFDPKTNSKLSREILFLEFVNNSEYTSLKKSVPTMYTSGTNSRSWYIREYLFGDTQNINGSNIRFKRSFFNDKNLNWLIKFFSTLQKIKNRELPPGLRKYLLRSADFNKQIWVFIKPHFKLIEGYLRMPGVSKRFSKIVKEYIPTYNQASRVLSHQEPYPSHLIKNNGQFTLIDWENVNWANPVHDMVILWMRAYDHPAWQKKLYFNFKEYYRNYDDFDRLWEIETFIQSCFNIISYYFHNDTKDLGGLAKFSDRKIKEILEDDFRIHN
ncbi:MAG: hypothetical protein COT24_01580 [Candidatus Kerfeldbacteria bacterium CG08_land_8_20_14_0_20_40_16]|uniref:Aminoglycoside phosphotransferase domain-containing protein n=1 Tax=Candidatus Kerfeldbacteria bacterium CG08_land_8_20_14_0_20_40_16 TaxID=2014244 RepID=A0A2H0YYI8_9BACT|nr:MAG: hypothetical protein COT24_01580 [Candidatus Kerfeldbacteria bacterium CG08_land_8_20_14_0_20_40_16]